VARIENEEAEDTTEAGDPSPAPPRVFCAKSAETLENITVKIYGATREFIRV